MEKLKGLIGRNCTCMASSVDWKPGWWTINDIRVLDSIINEVVIYLEFKLTRYKSFTNRPHTNIQLAAYTSSGKIQYFMDWGELKLQTEQEMINYCKEQDLSYKIYETY